MGGIYQIMYFTLIDIKNTLYSPFFIAILLIIYYQYYKTHIKKKRLEYSTSILFKTLGSAFYGIVGGFITTIAFIYLEVVVIPKDFMYILSMALILSLIDQRFICFAYAGSLISLLNIAIGFPQIDNKDIMLIVATMHIIESVLVIINGDKGSEKASFLYEDTIAGGFILNRFWPMPFVVFIGDDLIKPITLMAVLNYSDITLSYPKNKSIFTGILMLFYSLSLLFITKALDNNLIPPLFAIMGHELIILLNKYYEKNRFPIFKLPKKGVRVMEVFGKGIGKEIGLKTGDIILSINNVIINDDKDLYHIENLNNKNMHFILFTKNKGISEINYKGNKKTLGISIVPRD